MDGDSDDGKIDGACNGDTQVVIPREEYDCKDELDRLPNGCHVTNWDIMVLFISIISHLLDVAFDINLAYRYSISKEESAKKYFILTTAIILFPAIVNTFVSVRMYMVSDDNTSPSQMVVKKWTIRIFVLLLQLAPIMRYCDSLDYALKSRRAEKRKDVAEQRRNYLLMLKEDSDVALLRVFECFLEAAPQQILQIAIIVIRPTTKPIEWIHQVGSIVSSFCSMSWSMASYHRSIRFCQVDKSNLTWPASCVQFLWHFMITVSRILSISVVASSFPYITGLACLVHWVAMTFWLALFEHTQFAMATNSSFRAKFSEVIFCSILGLVYIFTYLTPSEGSTRKRYLLYYPVCFIENVIAVSVWATFAPPNIREWKFFYPLIVSAIVPFILGIFFMIIYYWYFHPETSTRRLSTPNVYSPKAAQIQSSRQDSASIRDIIPETSGSGVKGGSATLLTLIVPAAKISFFLRTSKRPYDEK